MGSCENCELRYDYCALGAGKADEETDKRILEYVQAWSDAHPPKTYMMDFLEKFPNCAKDAEGLPEECRRHIYPLTSGKNCTELSCLECWNEPMEDDRS